MPTADRRGARRQLAACLALVAVGQTVGKVVVGTVKSTEGFGFLGRFVFDCTGTNCKYAKQPSTMTMSTEFLLDNCQSKPLAYQRMAMYCYDDEGYNGDAKSQSWYGVYKDGHPASTDPLKIRGLAKITMPNVTGQYLRWDSNCKATVRASVTERIRPRTWFCVLASSDGTKMLPFEQVKYTMRFTNQGGTWQKQFGTDEQGLNIMYLMYLVLYAIMFGLQMKVREQYKSHHQLPKLLDLAVLLHLVAAIFYVLHYWTYAYDGIGAPFVKFSAELIEAAAKITMLLMLLLIAQGWTILRAGIQDRVRVIGLMAGFALASLLLIGYAAFPASSNYESDNNYGSFGRDPAEGASYHFSGPGTLLLVAHVAVAAVFIVTLQATLKAPALQEINQRTFVLRFGTFYTAYLIALPVVVTIFTFISPWVREYWVRTIDMTAQFIAPALMLFLIWPSRLQKHFLVEGSFADADDSSASAMENFGAEGNRGLLGESGSDGI